MNGFNAPDVSVDNTFARFGAKSYAINKINSVEVRERKPHGIVGILFFGFLAICFALSAFGSLIGPKPAEGAGVSIVVALILGGLTFICVRRHQIIEYQLFLMTSSSEAQAYQTRDKGEVVKLRSAIETAMVASGNG